MGRRDAKHFLEKLDGVDEFATAAVLLWSLGGHAIPVDDRLLEALRQADLVHPEATRAEVQAFLERNISAAEAKRFCLAMRTFAASGAGKSSAKAAKKRKRSAASATKKKRTTSKSG